MSPEVFLAYLRKSGAYGYDFASEVWSIGCILLDMATSKGVFFSQRSDSGSPVGLRIAEEIGKSSSGAATKESDFQHLIDDEVPPVRLHKSVFKFGDGFPTALHSN
eukprot:m.137099 g.137099  ORF g.137099 m.137099 type:complete len:106 (+) comp38209_c0_seq15:1735-2052(+)